MDDAVMRPVVMKFGGSSVADLERLRRVARRVVARAQERKVAVVVSAMGKTTNNLVAEACALLDPPPARELDMLMTTGERISMALLAIAIAAEGRTAISLTGSQCGIITNHQAGRARIVEVRPFRVEDEWAEGHVVIVGGFAGVSYKREVTTLGRGGSDTTAVALAAALGADCEIYSDVDGVYSGDPRELPAAQRIAALSYEEMQALSRAGAKVLHAQAVELAEERGIAIYARHSDPAIVGETVIRTNPARRSGVCAVTTDLVRDVEVALTADDPELRARLRGEAAEAGLLYLRCDRGGLSGLLSTRRTDASALARRFAGFAGVAGVARAAVSDERALVSCVGAGLEDRPELFREAEEALAAAGIAVEALLTDARTLSVLVDAGQRAAAAAALHARFIAGPPR
ncbi:MAG: aspartate kinase [Nannocystaceae bacterium]